jgi:uncharacterized membrane protein YccC
LCFAFRELATVHYGIAVVCLTGLVVILLSFYGVPAAASVQARALDTLLGSALALLAYFAWPTWERGRERAVLAALLEAYADYLDATLRGDAQARHETRIDARAARSSAQASLDRLRAEPASRANVPRAEALVAQANRLMRAAMMLEATRTWKPRAPTTPCRRTRDSTHSRRPATRPCATARPHCGIRARRKAIAPCVHSNVRLRHRSRTRTTHSTSACSMPATAPSMPSTACCTCWRSPATPHRRSLPAGDASAARRRTPTVSSPPRR